MNRSPAQLLAAALAVEPGRPFVTYYDDATGERVELSVTTFANWVAKTANLLVDGIGLVPGDVVRLDLPRHWLTPVWALGAWSAGLTVDLVGDPGDAALAVCGPNGLSRADGAPEVVALSLRPMGAPFAPGVLPAGVLDYGREVAGYGDRFSGAGAFGQGQAVVVASSGELGLDAAVGRADDLSRAWELAVGGRLLVHGVLEPLDDLLAGTLVPLVRAGSAVLVAGAITADRRTALATTERCTTTTPTPSP